jgi:hypothetical protein
LSTFVNVGPGTDAGSIRFAHNLWYARDNPGQSRPTLPSAETAGLVGLDPRLADPTGGESSLLPDSPALGRGRPLPEVRADGARRCYATPPSIGAWEANPPAPADTDGDGLPDWWEFRHGTGATNSADAPWDVDGDGHDARAEFRAGTDPGDRASVLAIAGILPGPEAMRVAFPGVHSNLYQLQHRSGGTGGAAAPWQVVGALRGTGRRQEFVVTRESGAAGLYRIRVDAE